MRVSREQVSANRQTILDAAARLFRERGFDAVTVSDVMKSAGLTHGGFYGYFKSKEDLIAQALAEALKSDAQPFADLAPFAKQYLSSAHRDDFSGGCVFAALAAETARQTGDVRATMTDGLKAQIKQISEIATGANETEKRRAAIGTWASMVGALILSRMSEDEALSDEILSATAAWLATREEVESEDTPR